MSIVYTPTGTYHPQLTFPSPGQAATAASVNEAAFKFLADNAEFARQGLGIVYTRRVPTASSRGGADYDADRSFFPASALGAEGVNSVIALTLLNDRTWTIDDESCVNGDWFYVANTSTTFSIVVNTPTDLALVTLQPGDWCMFERTGGGWGFTQKQLRGGDIVTRGLEATGDVSVAGFLQAGSLSVDTDIVAQGFVVATGAAFNGTVSANRVEAGFVTAPSAEFPDALGAGLANAFSVDSNGNVVAPQVSALLAFLNTVLGRFVFGPVLSNTVTQTVSPVQGNVWVTTLSVASTWTIAETNQDGDWLWIRCFGAGPISIYNPGGTLLWTLGATQWAFFVRISGTWYVMGNN